MSCIKNAEVETSRKLVSLDETMKKFLIKIGAVILLESVPRHSPEHSSFMRSVSRHLKNSTGTHIPKKGSVGLLNDTVNRCEMIPMPGVTYDDKHLDRDAVQSLKQHIIAVMMKSLKTEGVRA